MTTIFPLAIFHKEIEMSFKDSYPEYAAIEEHIRRARLERSVAIAHMFASVIDTSWRGLRKIGAAVANLKVSRPARSLPAR